MSDHLVIEQLHIDGRFVGLREYQEIRNITVAPPAR